jgi:hypothetical protein
MTRLFESWREDLSDYAAEFGANDFIVIKNGVHIDFLDYAKSQIDQCVEGGDISHSKRRLKQEYLFEFPHQQETVVELVETIGALTGLPSKDLIVSERHLKIYREDAPQNPPPHKDRHGTQLSIGIPLEVGLDSRLILYPFHERGENRFDSYDDFLDSLSKEERPENALREIDPVVIDTRPGDLIVFWGSTIWHERTNAAGSKLLYFKMNALGLDPLKENLATLPLARVSG